METTDSFGRLPTDVLARMLAFYQAPRFDFIISTIYDPTEGCNFTIEINSSLIKIELFNTYYLTVEGSDKLRYEVSMTTNKTVNTIIEDIKLLVIKMDSDLIEYEGSVLGIDIKYKTGKFTITYKRFSVTVPVSIESKGSLIGALTKVSNFIEELIKDDYYINPHYFSTCYCYEYES